MGKSRLNITLNLDMGKQEVSAAPKSNHSTLVKELKSMRKDISRMSKKQSQPKAVQSKQKVVERIIEKTKHVRARSNNTLNSLLVSELRGLRKEISALPHVIHPGGG